MHFRLRCCRTPDINGFLDVEARTSLAIPLMTSKAACCFSSPDDLDSPLDFDELLLQTPAAAFAVRIDGESMTGVGLLPGNVAVVDRAIKPFERLNRARAGQRRIYHQTLLRGR